MGKRGKGAASIQERETVGKTGAVVDLAEGFVNPPI